MHAVNLLPGRCSQTLRSSFLQQDVLRNLPGGNGKRILTFPTSPCMHVTRTHISVELRKICQPNTKTKDKTLSKQTLVTCLP